MNAKCYLLSGLSLALVLLAITLSACGAPTGSNPLPTKIISQVEPITGVSGTSEATQVIVFDPRSVKLDSGLEPLKVTCANSAVVPRIGAYKCTTAAGGNLDPCFVIEGNTLVCNPNPVRDSRSLVTASLPLPEGGATQDKPVAFFLELASGYPPCAKRADWKKELAGQPVTYSCQAPGAWLLGNVDVARSAWVVQYITTDTQGAQVTFGPKTVQVIRAWVY